MSLHRSSMQDTAVRPPVTTTRHTDPEPEWVTTPATTTDPGPVATNGGNPGGRCGWPSR